MPEWTLWILDPRHWPYTEVFKFCFAFLTLSKFDTRNLQLFKVTCYNNQVQIVQSYKLSIQFNSKLNIKFVIILKDIKLCYHYDTSIQYGQKVFSDTCHYRSQ